MSQFKESEIYFKAGSNVLVLDPKVECQFGFFATSDPSLVKVEHVHLACERNAQGFDIEHADDLLSLNFPNLQFITDDGILKIDDCDKLVSIQAPLLETVGGVITIQNCALLTSVGLESLLIAGGLVIKTNAALTVIHLPNVTEITGAVDLSDNLIASIDADTLTALDLACSDDIDLSGNALTNAAIAAICTALTTTWGALGNTLDLSGGTNAIPAGAAATAVTALEGAGATVTVNS